MRIIGGKFRSKRFKAPGNITARPTTDFAKEALFNILNNNYHIEDLVVLDLFAGIGSISLEFASRGAEDITVIEKDRRHIKFINKMVEELDLFDSIHTIQLDVFKYLKTCTRKFNMIFADPPYSMESGFEIPKLVFEKELLLPGGMLIYEHHKHITPEENDYFVETRNYGNLSFSFYEMPD
ncbi:MAG: RsmD family RNA methyltransferase [Flavobacteriales bacterium]